ncbi:MAG: hypothetical protein MJK10_07065 [Pseudomonadales bacterium]|nr:hypothetical protein [Pseudomonadales bacterium]NRA13939.1 hypothetical protein [Oceanospirillaceae bacterium]
MTDNNDQRIARDFSARSQAEQQDFIENTWCDACQKENLGLNSPCEYEQSGIIYVEGKCNVCAKMVVTEFTDDEF